MSTRYLEDFAVGDVMATTPVTVSQQDILEFGARYDPQPMHTDPQAAARVHDLTVFQIDDRDNLHRALPLSALER